jgi:hypothetical protein
LNVVADTVGRRLGGERPSRTRALTVAAISGVAVGALVYKLLRAEGEAEQT